MYQASDVLTQAAVHTLEVQTSAYPNPNPNPNPTPSPNQVQICTDLKRARALPRQGRQRVLPVTPLTPADFHACSAAEGPSTGSAASTPPVARVDWSQQFDDEGRATGACQAP